VSGFYVYGVVAAGSAVPASPVAVRLVECGSLAAVVGDVSLEEFGEDALARNLNDREWLEAHARTHDAVLHAFVGVTPVVPLRFGAIYRTEDEVRRMLETRREFFETTLAQLRGRVEMGVKAWIDRAAFQRQLARRGAAEEAASGRGYLERRQSELAAAGEASRRVAELARASHERLLAAAVDGVTNRAQPRELTGRLDEMILNGAYLVPEDDSRLVDEVARLSEEWGRLGVSFEATGPWPPYNFARIEEPAR